MTTKENIINWINKFKALHPAEMEDCFLHGDCYWFALILANRFSGEIYYLPIENHFICKVINREPYHVEGERGCRFKNISLGYFDITGELTNLLEEPINWNNYIHDTTYDAKNRPEVSRIFRDCINWSEEI